MKALGVILVILSAGSVGIQLSAGLKNRCRLLIGTDKAMQILRNEIGICGTPLPQAFALAAVSVAGVLEELFSDMAMQLEQRRWMTPRAAMEQGLEQLPNLHSDQELTELFLALSDGLGNYDRNNQLAALDRAIERLQGMMAQAEKDRKISGKTYQTLGICAGISMAILLV